MSESVKEINVLLIDDHHFIIEAYINIFNIYPNKSYKFNYYRAIDCESGYNIITSPPVVFDIAFLDISMPTYTKKGIESGEDLAKLLQKEHPNCRIVLLTMHSENLKALRIVNEINPHGLIIKNDLDHIVMRNAITAALDDEKFYSEKILEFLNILQSDRIFIDVFDRQILYYLEKGYTEDDISLYSPLGFAQVLDRIEKMHQRLEISQETTTKPEFLKAAKSRGMFL